jgi:hypothetical protein
MVFYNFICYAGSLFFDSACSRNNWTLLFNVEFLCCREYCNVSKKAGPDCWNSVEPVHTWNFRYLYMDLDCIIGIDPGKTGGIAVKFHNKRKVYKMPEDLLKFQDLIKYYRSITESMLVVIEKVQLLPYDVHTDDHKKFGRAMRVQKLLTQFEQMKTVLIVLGIPFVTVTPRSWITYLNLNTKNKKRDERKRIYRDFAQSQWIERVNLDVADSVCILIYALRRLRYDPDFVSELPKELQQKLF